MIRSQKLQIWLRIFEWSFACPVTVSETHKAFFCCWRFCISRFTKCRTFLMFKRTATKPHLLIPEKRLCHPPITCMATTQQARKHLNVKTNFTPYPEKCGASIFSWRQVRQIGLCNKCPISVRRQRHSAPEHQKLSTHPINRQGFILTMISNIIPVQVTALLQVLLFSLHSKQNKRDIFNQNTKGDAVVLLSWGCWWAVPLQQVAP